MPLVPTNTEAEMIDQMYKCLARFMDADTMDERLFQAESLYSISETLCKYTKVRMRLDDGSGKMIGP